MGLDLSIKNYESENSKIGSYSGFNRFRETWAKHLGFDLEKMEGMGGDKKWTNEPLQSFFRHSDCDGNLTVEECKEILLQAKKDSYLLKGDSQCDYSFPILIEFCEKAIELNQEIEFC